MPSSPNKRKKTWEILLLRKPPPHPRHPNIDVPPGFKAEELISSNQVQPKRAGMFCLMHTVMLKPREWGFS